MAHEGTALLVVALPNLAVHVGTSTGGSTGVDRIIFGVDPHKLSATIEAVDDHERRPGHGRVTTDMAGYAAMLGYAKAWPARTWAVEGANMVGRPLAQRLLEAGENVVDVPAKLAAPVGHRPQPQDRCP